MEILKNYKLIKILFFTIWVFFIFRLTSFIKLGGIYNRKFFEIGENWINFLTENLSIVICTVLFCFLIVRSIKSKKISLETFLLIYPILGCLGYYLGGFKNHYQDSIIIHHFVTLTSVIIFFSIINSEAKVFDYKFKELLFKFLLFFIIMYLFIIVFPNYLSKLLTYTSFEELRVSFKSTINLFGRDFYFDQNVNGQTKFILIFQIIALFLFKNFLTKKKIIPYIFFYILSVISIILIYLVQSRFNIISSFIISFFIIINISSLKIEHKILSILIIILAPLLFFNLYTNNQEKFSMEIQGRFLTDYQVPVVSKENKIEDFSELKNKTFKETTKILDVSKKLFKLEKNSKEFEYNYIIKNLDIEQIQNFHTKYNLNDINTYDLKLILKIHYQYMPLYNSVNKILKDFDINKNPYLKYNYEYIEMLNLSLYMKNYKNFLQRNVMSHCSEILRPLDNILSGRVCGWEILLKTLKSKDILFGNGYFADQVYLKIPEKTSSNTWINILFNGGVISLLVSVIFVFVYLLKFFKKKNINHKNLYISISHYLIIYILFRSIFEDTLAFVSIDFLLLGISLLMIKESKILR